MEIASVAGGCCGKSGIRLQVPLKYQTYQTSSHDLRMSLACVNLKYVFLLLNNVGKCCMQAKLFYILGSEKE